MGGCASKTIQDNQKEVEITIEQLPINENKLRADKKEIRRSSREFSDDSKIGLSEFYPKSLSESHSRPQTSHSKLSGEVSLNRSYTSNGDKFTEFITKGGNLSDLLEKYQPPADWNDKLIKSNMVKCIAITSKTGEPMFVATIHVNDEEICTKRHFLAFYNLTPHYMEPKEFFDWCIQNQMYNTCSDYLALYLTSRFHGQGSRCLIGLASDKSAHKIEMSDRFTTATGVYRAITFYSNSIQAVRRLANSYMLRLEPKAFRSVRSAFPSYLMIDGR